DGLDAKANYLLHKLLLSNVGKRPIVWVTHSMGGLLVKQILVEAAASKDRKVNAIAQKTTDFGELKKSKWGLTYSMLVTEDSSDPGLGEFYALPLDHLSTCKPESQESKVYEKTIEFLIQCIPQSSDFLQYSNLEIEISNILCLI
ncbi:protein SERAC1, partial [Trichonephila clavata]